MNINEQRRFSLSLQMGLCKNPTPPEPWSVLLSCVAFMYQCVLYVLLVMKHCVMLIFGKIYDVYRLRRKFEGHICVPNECIGVGFPRFTIPTIPLSACCAFYLLLFKRLTGTIWCICAVVLHPCYRERFTRSCIISMVLLFLFGCQVCLTRESFTCAKFFCCCYKHTCCK